MVHREVAFRRALQKGIKNVNGILRDRDFMQADTTVKVNTALSGTIKVR